MYNTGMFQQKTGFQLALLILFLAGSSLSAQTTQPRKPPEKPWIPCGKLDSARIKEASGIVKSRKHPGIFWTHGDSGNPPRLIAFRLDGTIVAEIDVVKTPNTDWEDIAIDKKGNLWIGDIGNNHKIFSARYLYVIPEPDLPESGKSKVSRTHRWKYKFPTKKERFNSESLYINNEKPYVITIGLSEGRPEIIDFKKKNDNELLPEPVYTFRFYQARAADVSEDGKYLVVSMPERIMMIPLGPDGLPLEKTAPLQVSFPTCYAEGVCFDGEDVVMVNEAGEIYAIPKEDFEAGVKYIQPNPDSSSSDKKRK